MNEKHTDARAQKIALVVGAIFSLTFFFYLIFAGTRGSELRSFVVDLKRANVPQDTPDPTGNTGEPPVAFGIVRFNELQGLVDWTIHDSFRDAYPGQVADLRFHGPLEVNETVAPVLFAMGLQTQARDHRVFSGSSVVGIETFSSVSIDWGRFYVALYVKNSGSSAHIEVARSSLIRSKKQ